MYIDLKTELNIGDLKPILNSRLLAYWSLAVLNQNGGSNGAIFWRFNGNAPEYITESPFG